MSAGRWIRVVTAALAPLLLAPPLVGQCGGDDLTSSAHTQVLGALVGEWRGTVTLPASLDDPEIREEPVGASFVWLHGRHVQGTLRYDLDGEPYTVQLTLSYDPQDGRYQAHWIDDRFSASYFYEGSQRGDGSLELYTAGQTSASTRFQLRVHPTGDRSGLTLLSSAEEDGAFDDPVAFRLRAR